MFRKSLQLKALFLGPRFELKCVPRLLHTSPLAAMPSPQFEQAKQKLNSLQDDPGNDVKLKLYALFKQTTTGQCNTPKPGMMDFVAKAKWQAWSSLGVMSKEEAEKQYISLVEELAANAPPTSEAAPPSSMDKYPGLSLSVKDGITLITLNRPAKKNSLTQEMYLGIGDLLDEAARDPKCKAVAFTGTGDYYCSGNDLSNFIKGAQGGDIPTMAAQSGKLLQKYIDSYIDFPKPLIVGINGHAIGISVTVLGLCDLVFSSDQATFHTPFSSLGQAPEGCSSLLFRRLMGSKANRMLMLNYKMKAKEAYECGLVSELLPHDNFASEFAQRLQQIAQLPAESLRCAKRPAQELEKELLHKINAKECEQLVERWQSDDCMAALAKFFQRSKSNL